MRAMLHFMRGLLHMPLYARLWVAVLVTVNLLIPLAHLGRPEARWTLAAMLVGAGLMVLITARTGFSRLLGLGHVVWFPLLVALWTRLDAVPPTDAYGLWMRAVIVLNAISLVIDVADVVRYVRGDRAEMASVGDPEPAAS